VSRHRPTWLGAGLSALLIPVHLFVAQPLSIQISALLLAVIAGAYIGFAAVDGRASALLVELTGAALFSLAALAGLNGYPLAIPIAFMAHAGWDWLHHGRAHFGAAVPGWYIPFCVVIDLLVGGALLILYLR